MKLCVSSTGKDIGSRVDTAFGRAPYFLIIDTETMDLEVLKNSAATVGHGAGIAAAKTVSDKGVDAVLSGYVGPKAFNGLQASDIMVFEGASEKDTIQEALTKFKRNEYRETITFTEGPGCGPGKGRGMGQGRGRGGCRRQ
jgi:predicted Fe-Mo cluster-binding NifX family protein